MLGKLGKKSSTFITFTLIVAIWSSGKKEESSQPYLKTGVLKKFREIPIRPFNTPLPLDHSHIYETVEEVPEPFPAEKSSGKVPDWLQGM